LLFDARADGYAEVAVNVLVIDVGGSHVKLLATGQPEPRRFDSGPDFTPAALVAKVKELTPDWRYEVVSLGYPGAVDADGPTAEPGNLSDGWLGFDFAAAFGRPVRVVNDAAMQALGAYDGGRMLFLGLGTGLGSALVIDRVVVPLELGCLPAAGGDTLADRLGKAGLERHGPAAWGKAVHAAVEALKRAFAADHVVLGGGNAERVDPLPAGTRRGGNEDAFAGGFRLWEDWVEPFDQALSAEWRVVR
jgi:polyphosphate glucokinase